MLCRLDSGILDGTLPATSVDTAPVTGIGREVFLHASATGTSDVSVLGDGFGHTPLVVPIRGHLDSIKRLLKGDVYLGRGSRQRSLPKSRYCIQGLTGWTIGRDLEFSRSITR